MTRVSLDAEQMAVVGGSWLQERYHSGDGATVAEFLSFESVNEINPFEVGASHSRERREYRRRRAVVDGLLDIPPLRARAVASLSNGELRRVIVARTLLKESGRVVLDGGCGGIDESWRRRIAEAADAMRRFGVDLRVARARGEARVKERPVAARKAAAQADGVARAVFEMRGVDLSFGGRALFRDFSWTVHEGEHWVLRGPNGSGKTTLLALVTGDCPFSYACDMTVLGAKRGAPGVTLARSRAKIGSVSSMRQAFGGADPDVQLSDALRPSTRLLLLDEPCCGMSSRDAARFAGRVVRWLDAHPRVAAVWVEHLPSRIPQSFTLLKELRPCLR